MLLNKDNPSIKDNCPEFILVPSVLYSEVPLYIHTILRRARPYHRMKLMLVGKAARGKTTLLMKISEKGQRGVQENWGTKRCGKHDEV